MKEDNSLLNTQSTGYPQYGASGRISGQNDQGASASNLPTYQEAMGFPNFAPSGFNFDAANSGATSEFTQGQFFPQLPESITLKVTTEGVFSSDSSLNADPELLSRFFYSNNQRPSLWVDIRGYEVERISEEVHTLDSEGRNQVTNQTRDQNKTYFELSYDVSQFVSSTGNIHIPSSGDSVEEIQCLLSEHASDPNRLKRIVLKKEVQWDYGGLTQALTAAIRFKGFRHLLSINYRLENHILEVASDSKLARWLRHPLSKFLCAISCLCIVAWPTAFLYRRKHERKLTSTFAMSITPEEWYNRNIASLMRSLDETYYF